MKLTNKLRKVKPLNIYLSTALTLAIGASGSLLMQNLPAGAVVGSMIMVAAAALFSLPVTAPKPLGWLCFTVLGAMLGTGVSRDFLLRLPEFSFSLLVMTGSLALSMTLSFLLLRKFFRLDRETAFLAPLPGAISIAIEAADSGVGRPNVIRTVQVFRLITLTALVPLAFSFSPHPPNNVDLVSLGLLPSLLMVGVGLGLGSVLIRLHLPSAFFIAGFLVSAITTGFSLTTGKLDPNLFAVSLSGLGAFLGARVALISIKELGLILPIAAANLGVMISVAVLAASFAYLIAAIPLQQALIAFTPGGVEAMVAVGLALGLDPLFIAGHHLVRIILLILSVALLMWLNRKTR